MTFRNFSFSSLKIVLMHGILTRTAIKMPKMACDEKPRSGKKNVCAFSNSMSKIAFLKLDTQLTLSTFIKR